MQPAKGASLSLRIQVNQSLSHFSLIAQDAANNARYCSKVKNINAVITTNSIKPEP